MRPLPDIIALVRAPFFASPSEILKSFLLLFEIGLGTEHYGPRIHSSIAAARFL